MIEEDLFSHLSTDTALNLLINERVYPSIMPQDCVKPALVYTITNNRELQALNSREPYGFDVRVQIDCWAVTLSEAIGLKNSVQSAMHKFAHKAHGFNSRTLYEPDTKLHRQLIEFNIKG